MSQDGRALGTWGENVAVQYLQERGYRILDRNWKTKLGEIDIIALAGTTIVFVEVKTRLTNRYGYAEESVTDKKQRTLRKLAELYLRNHRVVGSSHRIDVIAITSTVSDVPPEIRHIVDAVSG